MSWACAVAPAPYGLGMTSQESWQYTPREFSAIGLIRRRHMELWAIERVEFRNAHQLFGEDGIPWQLEDLMGTGNRRERAQKAKDEKIARDLELMKLQRGLGSITAKSAPEELLPSWAVRQWDPKDYPHLFGGKVN